MLTKSTPAADINLLTSPQPCFTITTDEEQTGALNGKIAMHYMGKPIFPDQDGLSGGLVVTTYAARTHPLHAPTVMADVRVGRYVRDNTTGEWCIITRNDRDGITRLQYVRITDAVARERICLTCYSDLFDKGDILGSVMFECHDREWRPCPGCGSMPWVKCGCIRQKRSFVRGLRDAALNVMNDGDASWRGKVRVTVISNVTRSKLLDIDACMDVKSYYHPSMDVALAAEMQRMAIIEKATSATCIPAPVAEAAAIEDAETDSPLLSGTTCVAESLVENSPQERLLRAVVDEIPTRLNKTEEAVVDTEVDVSGVPQETDTFDDVFGMELEDVEIADHFLILPDNPLPAEVFESAMLPADPSTLPGGTEMCLDGMDVDDDWCSLMTSDRDTQSLSSTLSTVGSDIAPEPSAVPSPQLEGVAFPRGEQMPAMSLPASFANAQQLAGVGTSQMAGGMQALVAGPRVVPVQGVMAIAGPMGGGFGSGQKVESPVSTVNSPGLVGKQENVEVKFGDVQHALGAGGKQGRLLAPRPAGVPDGFIWQMAPFPGNQIALASRLDAMEKERKAEERRKKNRQAAARSNAKKKGVMDGIKAEIKQHRERAEQLRKKEEALLAENESLKKRVKLGM